MRGTSTVKCKRWHGTRGKGVPHYSDQGTSVAQVDMEYRPKQILFS